MEFNFVCSNTSSLDIDLFFSPLTEEDKFFIIYDTWDMANIMVEAGIFKSLSQARKNGYDNKSIPFGFSDMRKGKLKIRITILNWNGDKQ